MRQKGAVERFVFQVNGQSLRLKDASEIVRISLADDEDVISVMRSGDKRVHAAAPHEDDLVAFAKIRNSVHLSPNGAFADVKDLDAAVKVRRGVRVAAEKKFYGVRTVMLRFIKRQFFHDVNN